jgi:hypothetical protein
MAFTLSAAEKARRTMRAVPVVDNLKSERKTIRNGCPLRASDAPTAGILMPVKLAEEVRADIRTVRIIGNRNRFAVADQTGLPVSRSAGFRIIPKASITAEIVVGDIIRHDQDDVGLYGSPQR